MENDVKRPHRFCLGTLGSLVFFTALQAAAQSSYQVIRVTNGGTITGTVRWTGTPVKPLLMPITKNDDVCDPSNGKTRDLERLIVGPAGGVENTVVYLKDVTKGKAMSLPDMRVTLNQKNCRYDPHILLVGINTEMRMKNSDPILHNVHMVGAAAYNLPFPLKDMDVKRSMHKAGVVDLKCDAGHVWMNAETLVVPHPYYTVTNERGEFKLADVPPGEYEVVAWHEGWTIVREESVMDVDAHREVHRPIFSDPKVWEEHVAVPASGTVTVNFEISEKSGS
jgi:hypothetical protein